MTTENTVLLTGQAREDYIKAHFTPEMVVAETLKIEVAYEAWYDGKSEDEQELIDVISDRTVHITHASDYDEFLEMLDSEGITTADEFDDRFECETEGYGERVYSEFAEELCDEVGYTMEPEWLRNCIDWEQVWYSALRFDYGTIEFKENTYFLRNS